MCLHPTFLNGVAHAFATVGLAVCGATVLVTYID